MIATMSASGVITLKAENSVESFALARWAEISILEYQVDVPGMPTRQRQKDAWKMSMLTVDASTGS